MNTNRVPRNRVHDPINGISRNRANAARLRSYATMNNLPQIGIRQQTAITGHRWNVVANTYEVHVFGYQTGTHQWVNSQTIAPLEYRNYLEGQFNSWLGFQLRSSIPRFVLTEWYRISRRPNIQPRLELGYNPYLNTVRLGLNLTLDTLADQNSTDGDDEAETADTTRANSPIPDLLELVETPAIQHREHEPLRQRFLGLDDPGSFRLTNGYWSRVPTPSHLMNGNSSPPITNNHQLNTAYDSEEYEVID